MEWREEEKGKRVCRAGLALSPEKIPISEETSGHK